MSDDTVVKLLATHIAESMVKSCQLACDCDSQDPDDFVNAMLNKETIEMIVNQIKNDECRCVKFKSGWLGAPSVNKLVIMAAPTAMKILNRCLETTCFKCAHQDAIMPI